MTVTAMSREPLALLVSAVDAVAEQVPMELPGPVALERTRVLLAQVDRLRALALQAVSDVEVRQLFAYDGSPTTASWVDAQGGAAVDRREVALAKRLSALPAVQAELVAGRLSAPAATLVATAVGRAAPFLDRADGLIDGQPALPVLRGVLVDGISDLLAEQTGGAPADDPLHGQLRAALEAIVESDVSERARVEAGFVLLARRSAPGLLRSALAMLLDALLPAEHDRRAARAEEDAGLDLHRRPDGSGWTVHGDLDDLCGEMLDTVLRAELAADPDAPADTDAHRAAAEQPELEGLAPEHWPAALPRPRSRRAQRHDALARALARLLGSGAIGVRDKAVPHVQITVGLDFVQGVPGSLPGRAASGARWSREQARRLLCRGSFTRMVLDAGRRFIEASHSQRTLTALERQVLHLQWGGLCAVDGCTRGFPTGDRLEPHHGELFSHTGATSLADAVPLCQHDHHVLHDRRRLLRLRDGRWLGPDGWVQQAAA